MKQNFFEKHKILVFIAILVAIVYVVGDNTQQPFNSYATESRVMMSEGMDFSGKMIAEDSIMPSGEKIRKTSSLTIEVDKKEFESKKSEIDSIIESNNGLYTNKNEYENSHYNNKYKNYRITIKVPVENNQATLTSLKALGNVEYFSENADDLTTQYTDVEAYLESYKKEKVKIESLLDRAETIEEIIQIENKLSSLQRTIDNYEKQKLNLDRQTEYSTIYVTLKEEVSTSTIFVQWTGIMDHLKNIVNGIDSVLVFITSYLGWAIFLLLIYGGYKLVKN